MEKNEIENSFGGDVFENLLDDSLATGFTDPVSGQHYDPVQDFDDFQNQSSATRTVSSEGDKVEMPSLLDDPKPGEPTQLEGSVLYDFLRSKNIDPESIKVQDEESGETLEYKFDDLSKEEKMDILGYQKEMYSDDEVDAINFLRTNKMSLQDLAQSIRNKTIEEYSQQSEQVYQVDDFSDDELFIVDFKNKYGEDFSEDELLSALDKAKENEALYEKQMARVRDSFKEYEAQAKEQESLRIQQEQNDAEEQYIAQVVNVARSLNDMHDTVDLDDTDKEDVLTFMFDKLPTGESALEKALKDPASRYKAAWYLKNGDEVFKEVHRYYKGEIERLNKEIKSGAKKPEAFIKKETNNKQHTTQKRPMKLEELYK